MEYVVIILETIGYQWKTYMVTDGHQIEIVFAS
jgi:hypothetical protein